MLGVTRTRGVLLLLTHIRHPSFQFRFTLSSLSLEKRNVEKSHATEKPDNKSPVEKYTRNGLGWINKNRDLRRARDRARALFIYFWNACAHRQVIFQFHILAISYTPIADRRLDRIRLYLKP